MPSDILAAGSNGWPQTRQERELARRKAEVRGDVQLLGYMADGSIALAAHMMDGLTELDGHRKEQAQDDVGLNLMCGQVQAMAIRKVNHLYARLFDEWGL